jgi:hypothetical protein
MAHTTIIVQRKGGGYVNGARVALGFAFSDHPFSSGNTDTVYTNSEGDAVVKHSNTGRATVYINGRVDGTINASGEKVVFI